MWLSRNPDKQIFDQLRKSLDEFVLSLMLSKCIDTTTYKQYRVKIKAIKKLRDIEPFSVELIKLYKDALDVKADDFAEVLIKNLRSLLDLSKALNNPAAYRAIVNFLRELELSKTSGYGQRQHIWLLSRFGISAPTRMLLERWHLTYELLYYNKEILIEIMNSNLGFIPLTLHDGFVSRLESGIPYEKLFNEMRQRIELAKKYFQEVGFTVYTQRIIDDNFWNFEDNNQLLKRYKFEKTGSVLIPLGGRFKTKIIVRIISQKAFDAWKKAQDAGIAVEEIIRAYPAKNGMVRVFCRYEGENLEQYLKKYPERKGICFEQRNKIIGQLEILNIEHGHLRDHNFTVKEVNGKIIVKAIDFDHAISP